MNKVVHLVRWLLPPTASFIRNQIVYHEQFEPSVVYAQKKDGPFFQEIAGRFETCYPLRSSWERLLYEKARKLAPRAKQEVVRFIRRQQPDILHVHYGVDCLVYADVLRELRLPSCVSFYGYDCTSFPNRFYGYGKTLLQKQVFHNPGVQAVLAMSDDMKQDLLGLGCPEEKIIVHYYGTETAPFTMQRSFPDKTKVDMLIISSLQERKGHGFIIDALAALPAYVRDKVHLHIVGDGYLRSTVEEKIRQSGLKNITMHGAVQYGSKQHLEYFKMADIFIHPSVTHTDGEKEGIPGAVIEAMAAGLPVISTYHAGIPHVMEDGRTGLLVKEYDVKALSVAMEKLILQRELRKSLGTAAQEEAVNRLDLVEKERELEEIYELLLGRRTELSSATAATTTTWA